MTDADFAVDDLKARIARDRRNGFLINMLGVAIAVAAVVVAGFYSLGEVGEAERQVAIVVEARDEAERQVAVVAEARDEAERQVAIVAEARDDAERQVAIVAGARDDAERQVAIVTGARDEARTAAEEVNRKFAEAESAAQMAQAEASRVSDQLRLTEDEVASLSAQIAQVQSGDEERVANLEAELAKAEASRAMLASQAGRLRDDARALITRLDKAQAASEEAQAQRSQLATTVAKLQSSAENARSEFNAVVAERESIGSELIQTQRAFAAVNTERSELAARISSLQSRDVVTRGKYESIVAQRNNLDRQAAALRLTAVARLETINKARDRLVKVEQQNKVLSRRVARLPANSGGESAQVKALENQISRLRKRNQSLLKQLAAVGSGQNGSDFACARSIQNKIAWDYKGSKKWGEESIKQLCGSQTRSVEPARCFQKVMFGGINRGGGTRWKWQDAIDLCEGASKASARIDCFKRALPRLRSQRAAIAACDERSARTR